MTATPSLRARAFLAAYFPTPDDSLYFDGTLRMPSDDSRAVLKELCALEILEPRHDVDGGVCYRLTSRGRNLNREPGATPDEAMAFILEHGRFPVHA